MDSMTVTTPLIGMVYDVTDDPFQDHDDPTARLELACARARCYMFGQNPTNAELIETTTRHLIGADRNLVEALLDDQAHGRVPAYGLFPEAL